MRPHGRDGQRRSPAHRLGVGCALVAYLAAAVGFPSPPASGRDLGQAFPCQQHACGCGSAESCWARCCCFSPEQKLRWAAVQGVEPPAYAARPAALGWRTERLRDREANQRGCDQPCCQTKRPARQAAGWKLGVNCLQCRGHSTLWITTGTVLPVPPLAWRPEWLLEQRLPNAEINGPNRCSPPPDPPPRCWS